MGSRLFFWSMRFWCWTCYRVYMAIPAPDSHASRYGQFNMWLLGYAGAYAHSDLSDFHLCNFFYRTKGDQSAAWERHIAALPPANWETP